jgi:L-lysine exporter family protein LysE/ArgO
MGAFLQGALLALGLIIPLGVQNLFIFNQGFTQPKWARALPSILTACLCDIALILSAILGVSVVVLSIPGVYTALLVSGIVFLTYIGWTAWSSQDTTESRPHPLSTGKQIAFAASVSLLNPHAILDTVGVIGTNSLHYTGTDKWFYTMACILVSLLWFTGLSLSGHLIKHKSRTNYSGINKLNKVSALIVWGIAVYLALSLIV